MPSLPLTAAGPLNKYKFASNERPRSGRPLGRSRLQLLRVRLAAAAVLPLAAQEPRDSQETSARPRPRPRPRHPRRCPRLPQEQRQALPQEGAQARLRIARHRAHHRAAAGVLFAKENGGAPRAGGGAAGGQRRPTSENGAEDRRPALRTSLCQKQQPFGRGVANRFQSPQPPAPLSPLPHRPHAAAAARSNSQDQLQPQPAPPPGAPLLPAGESPRVHADGAGGAAGGCAERPEGGAEDHGGPRRFSRAQGGAQQRGVHRLRAHRGQRRHAPAHAARPQEATDRRPPQTATNAPAPSRLLHLRRDLQVQNRKAQVQQEEGPLQIQDLNREIADRHYEIANGDEAVGGRGDGEIEGAVGAGVEEVAEEDGGCGGDPFDGGLVGVVVGGQGVSGAGAAARVREHAGPLTLADHAHPAQQTGEHEHAELHHRQVLPPPLRARHRTHPLQVILIFFNSHSPYSRKREKGNEGKGDRGVALMTSPLLYIRNVMGNSTDVCANPCMYDPEIIIKPEEEIAGVTKAEKLEPIVFDEADPASAIEKEHAAAPAAQTPQKRLLSPAASGLSPSPSPASGPSPTSKLTAAKASKLDFSGLVVISSESKASNLIEDEVAEVPYSVIRLTMSARLRRTVEELGEQIFMKYEKEEGPAAGWRLHRKGHYLNCLGERLYGVLTAHFYYEGELEETAEGILPANEGILLSEEGLYVGGFRAGRASGRGHFRDVDLKATFRGEWRDGALAEGSIENGSFRFEGAFRAGVAHGAGRLQFKEGGFTYSGQFEEGLFHDRNGFLEGKDYIYEGGFEGGRKQGAGCLVEKEQQHREKRDQRDKRQKYHPAEEFEGHWHRDSFEGRGRTSDTKRPIKR